MRKKLLLARYEKLKGNRYGSLVLLEYIGRIEGKRGKDYCLFMCDCGNETRASMGNVKAGNTSSCGCGQLSGLEERRLDFVGQQIGKLKVLRASRFRSELGQIIWECQCDCGDFCSRTSTQLKNRRSVSTCGKCESSFSGKDLTGMVFGRWTVLGLDGFKYTSSGGRLAQWQCRCVCGNERVVVGPALSSGISRGCGCLRASKYYRAFGEGKTLTMWSRDERCPVSYNTLRRRVLVLDWPIEKAISEPPGNRTMSSKT